MKDKDLEGDYTLEIPAKYTLTNYIDLRMQYNVSIMDGLKPLEYSFKSSLVD
jgi:hypothetical protein